MTIASKFGIPQALLDSIAKIQKEETEYQSKVKALMAKKGIKSLGELSPEEKKKFFNQLDSMHQAKNEEVVVNEACWDTHRQDGMKKKGNKMVPNCVPKGVNEAEVGGGTSIKDAQTQAKGQAERAKITMQSAMLKMKQAKERESLAKKKKSIQSQFDPSLKESFNDAQIAKLKAEYSKINTIDPSSDNYKKLTSMLDKMDKPTLEKLAGAGIKFVSGLAKNRVSRKSVKETLSPKQKELDKNKNGKIDGSDLAHLRSKKKAVAEGLMGKLKSMKRGAEAKAKAADHFDKAGDPKNANASKDLKKAVRYNNLLNKEEFVNEKDLDEAKSSYDIYHKDFSTAVQHAIKTAEKRGFQVDMDDWHNKVATGPRKPSEGKTNSYSITLMDKSGKPVKKALQMQVYNKGGQNPYELNMYIEETDVNNLFSEAMKKDKEATAKDKTKQVKSGEKLSGKKEPIDTEPEIDTRNMK
jgi:hypothetical protein